MDEVGLDVVYISAASDGSKYSGGNSGHLMWPGGVKALREAGSQAVAKLYYEAWIAGYNCFQTVT